MSALLSVPELAASAPGRTQYVALGSSMPKICGLRILSAQNCSQNFTPKLPCLLLGDNSRKPLSLLPSVSQFDHYLHDARVLETAYWFFS